MYQNPLFFFQAEDGIRVLYVTGVQTCALPISCAALARANAFTVRATCCSSVGPLPHPAAIAAAASAAAAGRSEERRVGKEGRSRWTQEYYNYKNFKLVVESYDKKRMKMVKLIK